MITADPYNIGMFILSPICEGLEDIMVNNQYCEGPLDNTSKIVNNNKETVQNITGSKDGNTSTDVDTNTPSTSTNSNTPGSDTDRVDNSLNDHEHNNTNTNFNHYNDPIAQEIEQAVADALRDDDCFKPNKDNDNNNSSLSMTERFMRDADEGSRHLFDYMNKDKNNSSKQENSEELNKPDRKDNNNDD